MAKLAEDSISSLNDFVWIFQLRYFWEDGEVMLRMITTCLKYGYEYLGSSPVWSSHSLLIAAIDNFQLVWSLMVLA